MRSSGVAMNALQSLSLAVGEFANYIQQVE
jgi:hypothetical protein